MRFILNKKSILQRWIVCFDYCDACYLRVDTKHEPCTECGATKFTTYYLGQDEHIDEMNEKRKAYIGRIL